MKGCGEKEDLCWSRKISCQWSDHVLLSSKPSLNSGVKTYSVNEKFGAHDGMMENKGHKTSEKGCATGEMGNYQMDASNNNNCVPAAKAQVIGWPPLRSYRKNTLATTSKNNDEVAGKSGVASLFVKVSMYGAPYLRKVDLNTYSTYKDLSSALGKMFCCFTLGQCGSNDPFGKESMNENNLKDPLHGSEYVLTYEDKDGDWMLVGDGPWNSSVPQQVGQQGLAKRLLS
ncbi:Auxin-responsive protein IAA8-like protein [Drosera capensis]